MHFAGFSVLGLVVVVGSMWSLSGLHDTQVS